jgi:hypothetical protein
MISDTVLSTFYKSNFQVQFYSVITGVVHNFCHIYERSHTVVFACIPRNFSLLQGCSVNLEQQCLQMYSYLARQVTIII